MASGLGKKHQLVIGQYGTDCFAWFLFGLLGRDGQSARELKKLEPLPSSFELEARSRPE